MPTRLNAPDALIGHYQKHYQKIERLDAMIHADLGQYFAAFQDKVRMLRRALMDIHAKGLTMDDQLIIPAALSDPELNEFQSKPPPFRVAAKRCKEQLLLDEFDSGNAQTRTRTKEQDKILEVFPIYELQEEALEKLVDLHTYTLNKLTWLKHTHPQLSYARVPTCTLRKHYEVLWYAYSPGMEKRFNDARANVQMALDNMQQGSRRHVELSQALAALTQLQWVYSQAYWEEVVEENTNLLGVYVSIRHVESDANADVKYDPADEHENIQHVMFQLSPALRNVLQYACGRNTAPTANATSTCLVHDPPPPPFGPFKNFNRFHGDVEKLLRPRNASRNNSRSNSRSDSRSDNILLVTYGYSGTGKTYNVENFLTEPGTAHTDNPKWLPADREFYYNDERVDQAYGTNLPQVKELFIRPTPNNPESSRAFTFIKVRNSNLTVLDMAGHEDDTWFVTLMMPTLNYELWQTRAMWGEAPIGLSDRVFMLFTWILDSMLGGTLEGHAYELPPKFKSRAEFLLPFDKPDEEDVEASARPMSARPMSARPKTPIDPRAANEKPVPAVRAVIYKAMRHDDVKFILQTYSIHHLLYRLIESGEGSACVRIHGMCAFACYMMLESLVVVNKDKLDYDYLDQFQFKAPDKAEVLDGKKKHARHYLYNKSSSDMLFTDLGSTLKSFALVVRRYLIYVYARYAMFYLRAQFDPQVKQPARTGRQKPPPPVPPRPPPAINAVTADMEYLKSIFIGTPNTSLGSKHLKAFAYIKNLWEEDWKASGLQSDHVQGVYQAMTDPSLIRRVQQQLFLEYTKHQAAHNSKPHSDPTGEVTAQDKVKVYSYYLKMVDLLQRGTVGNFTPGVASNISNEDLAVINTPWTAPLENPARMYVRDLVATYVLSYVKADIVDNAQRNKQPIRRVYLSDEVARLVREAKYIKQVNDNLQAYLNTRELRQYPDAVTRRIHEGKYRQIFMLANIRNDNALNQQVGAFKTLQYVQGIKSTA